MKNAIVVTLCLLFLAGHAFGQQPKSKVVLKLNHPQLLEPPVAETIQTKAIELLKTSNFNSKEHSGSQSSSPFQDGTHGVQRRYREMIAGRYLTLLLDKPQHFQLIRGHVMTIEVVIGLNDSHSADALFTIDPDGRIIEHSMFSGTLATELFELVSKSGKQN